MKVMVAGGFDPLHIGHLRHIQLASKLGDYLVVSVSSDDAMIRKKGYCFMPLAERMEILRGLSCVDEVIETLDKDGTQAKTLQKVKPDIFAKGGEYNMENLPQSEVKVCEALDIKIVFGVGERLNSSSDLVMRILQNAYGGNKWAGSS